MDTVIAEIVAERKRQVEAEGWTPEHDDAHTDGPLAQAAGCYALHSALQMMGTDRAGVPTPWPWADEFWKPKDTRRNLIRAAALIVAEIERLDRAALTSAQGLPVQREPGK